MAQTTPWAQWLARLQGDDPQAALEDWLRFPDAARPEARAVWRYIEQLALRGPNDAVRAAALQALASPTAQAFYARWRPTPPELRQWLYRELETWVADGLLTPEQAAVLRARYATAPRRPVPPKPAAEAPRRASPWALHIALYLGAFFTVAAALLLASLSQTWRLPILLAATGFFALAAGGVYRLTPTGGRVLALVAAGFLWADAAVLGNLLAPRLGDPDLHFYWAAAGMLIAVLWLLAGAALRSTALTLAAWPMLAYGLLRLGTGLDEAWDAFRLRPSMLSPVWAGLLLAAVGWSWLMRNRLPRGHRWLWAASHLVALLVGFWTAFFGLVDVADGFETWAWLGGWSAYLLLLAFYGLARRLIRPLPWVEAWAVPLTVLAMAFTWTFPWDHDQARGWALLGWAVLSALLAELAHRYARAMARAWRVGLELVAGVLFAFAGLWWGLDIPGQVRVWAALAWGLGALWGWWRGWRSERLAPTLFAAGLTPLAYGWALRYGWPGTASLYWPGWFFPLVVGLAVLDLTARARGLRVVRWAARGTATLLALALAAMALAPDRGAYGLRDAAVLAGLVAVLAGYAWLLRRPWLWGGVAFAVLAPWGVFIAALDAYHPAVLAAWPTLAALAAWALERRRRSPAHRAWGWGALAAAWLVAPLTVFYPDGWSVLALAVVATLTGASAWQWRDWALVLPTGMLYFWAYAWTLNLLEVRQPQFYTVPAALLGLLLHFLYRRGGHKLAATLIATLAQLVLFTTTYGQMLAHRSGWYFAMLFLQALVVLGYGVWTNEAALIWVPIGFAVLATASMVLMQFQGLGVLLLLCASGLALLFGGLYFLARRARGAQQPKE